MRKSQSMMCGLLVACLTGWMPLLAQDPSYIVGKDDVYFEGGDLSFFRSIHELRIVYDYSTMEVEQYKYEKDFIASVVDYLENKEPGAGKRWLENWEKAKAEDYPFKFEELLNKNLKKAKIQVSSLYRHAQYTLTVRTMYLHPGYDFYVTMLPAYLNVEYILSETAKPNKTLAKLRLRNILGQDVLGVGFDTRARIAEAYGKAGKVFGQYIVDKLKK